MFSKFWYFYVNTGFLLTIRKTSFLSIILLLDAGNEVSMKKHLINL